MKILLFPVLIYSFSGMVRKFKDPYFYACAFTFPMHSPWFLASLNSATFAFTLCKEVFLSPISVRERHHCIWELTGILDIIDSDHLYWQMRKLRLESLRELPKVELQNPCPSYHFFLPFWAKSGFTESLNLSRRLEPHVIIWNLMNLALVSALWTIFSWKFLMVTIMITQV